MFGFLRDNFGRIRKMGLKKDPTEKGDRFADISKENVFLGNYEADQDSPAKFTKIHTYSQDEIPIGIPYDQKPAPLCNHNTSLSVSQKSAACPLPGSQRTPPSKGDERKWVERKGKRIEARSLGRSTVALNR
uniref:Uncharacterized protein n=1 Tax=Vespula pensylvanica TaxID=30213 RepID=A0A834P8T4_VESPE|nr:hypothetical protein H0235_004664 [Vespula pensylvanica]